MTPCELAEAASVQRVVNAFLRETGSTPVPLGGRGPEGTAGAVAVPLPLTGCHLAAVPAQLSPTGHHRFGPVWWTARRDGWRAVGATGAVAAVLAEVAARDPEAGRRDARLATLVAQVDDSTARTARYLAAELDGSVPAPVAGHPDAFLRAEQALRTGHPFHPTPKTAEGFSAEDLERYAPELGATFPLHWLALAPEVATTATILAGERLGPLERVRSEARHRLGPAQEAWPLLPVHPWQAAYLERMPEMRSLVTAGLVLPLGPLGAAVRPTSSVRTVWDPGSARFLKLPLAVRVTNFVRVNPPDHLTRALHGSAVLARIVSRRRLDGLTVLLERGYRAVRPGGLPVEAADGLTAATAVVVREGPDLCSGTPMVIAALLEPSARTGEAPMAAAVAAARERGGTGSAVAWLARYLAVALVPLVRLLAEAGVGLEAHTQNALVTLAEGWPVRLHVRDLEGVAIDRGHERAADGYGGVLPADSPALYAPEEVWRRFAYYVVVNHLGDVVATLARSTGTGEGELWAEVRRCLVALAPALPADGRRRLLELVSAPELPAKANLISRFRECSEEPLFVGVPNPLQWCTD